MGSDCWLNQPSFPSAEPLRGGHAACYPHPDTSVGLCPSSRLFWACHSASFPRWNGRSNPEIQSTFPICLWLPPLSAVVWRMRSVAQHFLCDLLLCNQPSCTHWAICEKHQTEMPGWSAGPEKLRGEGAVLTLRFQTPSCTNWSRRKLHPSLWKRTRLKTQFYCLANCWELLMSAVNTHTKIVSFIVLLENKCTSVFRELALSCGRGIPQGTDESYLSYLRIPSEILWFHGPM